ncbi:MAG TPA: DUF1549 and DUF1553 domain-containing protein [Gemmataceae bacterium]|nr:DUF1549 and DUF1553 domain-containing protein [Gemmataceae bacterium]
MNTRFRKAGWHALAAVVVAALAVTGAAPAADKPDAAKLAHCIDRDIEQKLAAEKVAASPRADDAEFLRRAALDVTGVIPPAERVTAFLDSKDPARREKLIDELLASPQYGRHMADVWQHLMLPRDSDNRRLQPGPFVTWLEESFNANKPWDRTVREVLTATGSQDESPAVTYFLANPTVDKQTDSVARLFLGTQLQCAQCHNHPFTKWKQDDYWAMAAFFLKVRPDRLNPGAKPGNSPGVSEDGKGRPPRLPEAARTVPAKFFQGEQPRLDRNAPYRPVLADWIASPKNKFFARAMVNRTWGQFFGRGFVNPVDDLREDNVSSHPELLQDLADAFAASGFDLKFLVKAICLSETYNRTSRPASANEKDVMLFSHVAVKPLTPEQLYDSLNVVLGSPRGGEARGGKGQGGRRLGGGPREQFIAFFAADEGALATEYHAGIPQALRLMNAPQMNNTNAVAAAFARGDRSPAQVIEQLYVSALSRRPTAEETKRLTAYVEKHDGAARQAYGDVVWAVLNSSEFALNH